MNTVCSAEKMRQNKWT